MNPQSWVWDLIGWASLPIVAAIIIVFLYRKLVSEFPLFFSYLIVTEMVGLVRLLGSRATAHAYHNIYWVSDIVYTLFALTATYELFIKRLFPAFYKVRFYRYIFLVAVVVTTLLAIMIALVSGHARVLLSTIYIYNFIRAAILLFFVALMVIMGRQWNKQEFGIALGFGLDVSTSMAALGFWSHTPERDILIGQTSAVVYNVICLIWLYCFWSAKTTAITSSPTLSSETLREAKKWEGSLKDFIASDKR